MAKSMTVGKRENEKKTTKHSLSTDGCRISHFLWREEADI